MAGRTDDEDADAAEEKETEAERFLVVETANRKSQCVGVGLLVSVIVMAIGMIARTVVAHNDCVAMISRSAYSSHAEEQLLPW